MDIEKETDQDTGTSVKLSGKLLHAAWALWGAAALFDLTAFILMAVTLFNSYRQNMVLHFSRRVLIPSTYLPDLLEGMGWSLPAYVVYHEIVSWLPAVLAVLVGLFIFRQRPRSWMGIIASLFMISMGTQWVAFDNLRVYLPRLDWMDATLFWINLVFLALFFLLFPNGKMVPRRPYLPILGFALAAVPQIIIFFRVLEKVTDRLLEIYYIPFLATVRTTSGLDQFGIAMLIAVGAMTQAYRYFRRSNLAERQQIKWLGLGAFVIALAFGWLYFYYLPGIDYVFRPELLLHYAVINAAKMVVNLIIPVTIAIAIVRHQWLNIDYLINRSLVYGGLTLILAGLFGLSGLLFAQITGTENPMASLAVSGVLFGLLFQPARRRLQRLVDQRIYHIEIDYEKTPSPLVDYAEVMPQASFAGFTGLVLVGRGGMAEVYRAEHPDYDGPVALKLLPEELADDPDYRKRLEREAKVVAQIAHPNIEHIIKFDEEGSIPYLVLDFIQGPDLAAHLRKVGRIPLAQAVELIDQIADALDFAHEKGMVHRDIKPSNVMLEPGREGLKAILIDFGITKILGGYTMITQSGFVGTLDYISPEQIRASADVDRRADVYSCGVMAYQMLTGKKPFRHDNPGALLMAHISQPVPDPREEAPKLPSGAARAVMRAMAKEPDERFQSVGEFAEALRQAI